MSKQQPVTGLINGLSISFIKELKSGTTVIMDNAAFHKKDIVKNILKKHGHKALFYHHTPLTLIPLNFAIMKKKII